MDTKEIIVKAGEAVASGSGTVYGDVKQAIEVLASKTIDAVSQLAILLGTTATHIYQVYTKQQFVEGIVDVSLIVLAVISTIVLIVIFANSSQKTESRSSEDIGAEAFMFVCTWCLIVLLPTLLIRTPIKKIANPEYYSMLEITETIKENIKK